MTTTKKNCQMCLFALSQVAKEQAGLQRENFLPFIACLFGMQMGCKMGVFPSAFGGGNVRVGWAAVFPLIDWLCNE
jgi:hypothetical protein